MAVEERSSQLSDYLSQISRSAAHRMIILQLMRSLFGCVTACFYRCDVNISNLATFRALNEPLCSVLPAKATH